MNVKSLNLNLALGLFAIFVLPTMAIQLTPEEVRNLNKHPPLITSLEFEDASVTMPDGSEMPLIHYLLASDLNGKYLERLLKHFIRTSAPFLLNESVNAEGRTPIMLAASRKEFHLLFIYLLQTQGLPDAADNQGNNLLHLAALGGIEDNIFNIIVLDPHHFLMHQQNMLGQTPLMLAILSASVEAVRVLLLHGAAATLGLTDINGYNAIEIALEQDNSEIIELLTPFLSPSQDALLLGNEGSPQPSGTEASPVLFMPLGFSPSRTSAIPRPDVLRAAPPTLLLLSRRTSSPAARRRLTFSPHLPFDKGSSFLPPH